MLLIDIISSALVGEFNFTYILYIYLILSKNNKYMLLFHALKKKKMRLRGMQKSHTLELV